MRGNKLLLRTVLGLSGAVTARPVSTQLGSAWPSSAWLGSVRLRPTRLGLARAWPGLNLVSVSWAQLGSAPLGSAQRALPQPRLVRLSPAWLASARLGSTRRGLKTFQIFVSLCFRMVGWRGKSIEFIVKLMFFAKSGKGTLSERTLQSKNDCFVYSKRYIF